jgi:hypothetical protein
MSLRWTSVAIMRSQTLALGRAETSLYHLCRWPRCSEGLSFAQAEKIPYERTGLNQSINFYPMQKGASFNLEALEPELEKKLESRAAQ